MRQSSQRYPYDLGLLSIEPVGISFEDMLPTGRTLASATATLVDPTGVSTAIAANQIVTATPNTTITIGPFAAVGSYQLKVVGICSGSSPPDVPKLELDINIEVGF